MEIETPIRIPAPAPESHIEPEPSGKWCLQTSPELCMKRLLSAGYPKIYQICKCFRRNERGARHLPEFTMLEWYAAKTNYRDLMAECEALIRHIADEIGAGETIFYQGREISLDPGWPRLSVKDAFSAHAPASMEQSLENDTFDQIIAFDIEPCLGDERPVFLYDYPAQCAALAKISDEDPSVAERFELYIGGMELCNAFSELTEPDEQKKRFVQEREFQKRSGRRTYPLPEPFLESLADMPDASGAALGVDRLVMLFTNSERIDDVVAFPPESL